MIRYLFLLSLVVLLPLGAAAIPAEKIDVSLAALGSEEQLSDSKTLALLLERYSPSVSILHRRYRATAAEHRRIEEAFAEAGIPPYFSLIPYCESKFDPDARGYGTAGLWQFTRQSARNFGLTVQKGNDERLDTQRSTQAAIRYIKSLKRQFGSWYLVDFAYGMGEGKLQQLIRRNGSKKLSVLLKDPHFPSGTKAHFAKTLLLQARIAAAKEEKN
ncbi:hypothetical protein E0765_06700 [Sulfuricurvum sp. IAE1]|mgnify:FL=1|uniref:lytic transglycosylase domain-containing protein n=1 Tax=Sulfuricurvum sp. IAE1 TaxID=2546102 RepID=UPI0010436608|nr:lytic transglycosylase domain-containing protein [Sulfuricurvum sp. IAE1]TDA64395.1 hypothetical protein E0765_06700 [Sulfuricurvum sp. IAE1]